MHLVCLGVMKKLVFLWLKGPLGTRIGPAAVREISSEMNIYATQMPSEFNQKPRPLSEFERWKATEYRSFLLYTGPVCLKGRIPKVMYQNFMLLSAAITILLSVSLCAAQIDYAHHLLLLSIHSLLHLADNARMYGVLDNVSCFPFENFLGQLKKLVRKPSKPLEQVMCHLSEKKGMAVPNIDRVTFEMPHKNGPVPVLSRVQQYQKMNREHFSVQLSKGNNMVELNNMEVVQVVNIVVDKRGDAFIAFRAFRHKGDLFSYPLRSSSLLPVKDNSFAALPLLYL